MNSKQLRNRLSIWSVAALILASVEYLLAGLFVGSIYSFNKMDLFIMAAIMGVSSFLCYYTFNHLLKNVRANK